VKYSTLTWERIVDSYMTECLEQLLLDNEHES